MANDDVTKTRRGGLPRIHADDRERWRLAQAARRQPVKSKKRKIS